MVGGSMGSSSSWDGVQHASTGGKGFYCYACELEHGELEVKGGKRNWLHCLPFPFFFWFFVFILAQTLSLSKPLLTIFPALGSCLDLFFPLTNKILHPTLYLI